MSTQTTVVYRLTDPVTKLPKVGPAVAGMLAKLGITTVKDLLFHWPRRWLDLTNPQPVRSIVGDQLAVVAGSLSQIRVDFARGRAKARVHALLTDAAGDCIPIVWFNQTYLARTLHEGQPVLLVGKATWNWSTKQLQLQSPKIETEASILPIYPETEGLTSKFLRLLIEPLLDHVALPEILSSHTPTLAEAVRIMHCPGTLGAISLAKRRLALDELLALQYVVRSRRRSFQSHQAPVIPAAIAQLKALVAKLPFQLTNGQRVVAWERIQELARSVPMNRLLQGDVGTGKTVVAALVATSVLEAGYTVAWMAPTRVLARQLHARLVKDFQPLGHAPFLVEAGVKMSANESASLLVGTHALLHQVSRVQLGLAIVDEQHRFGVEQRQRLTTHSTTVPHLLAMTATPIPRSLALSIYGDVDTSVLTERPKHQQPVETLRIDPDQHDRVVSTMKEAFDRGEQAFVIVPRIERSAETLLARSLDDTVTWYRAQLSGVRIEPFHGQLSDEDKQAIMDQFEQGRIQCLVATSIVEVGIDVPNATVMVIEEADRFGLAQLHQLRGRIGRGERPGVCFVRSHARDEVTDRRLGAFVSTTDGLELAQVDLELRGPGDLLGTAQSGLPPLRIAKLTHLELVAEARTIADHWLENPPANLQDWLTLYPPTFRENLGG